MPLCRLNLNHMSETYSNKENKLAILKDAPVIEINKEQIKFNLEETRQQLEIKMSEVAALNIQIEYWENLLIKCEELGIVEKTDMPK